MWVFSEWAYKITDKSLKVGWITNNKNYSHFDCKMVHFFKKPFEFSFVEFSFFLELVVLENIFNFREIIRGIFVIKLLPHFLQML